MPLHVKCLEYLCAVVPHKHLLEGLSKEAEFKRGLIPILQSTVMRAGMLEACDISVHIYCAYDGSLEKGNQKSRRQSYVSS